DPLAPLAHGQSLVGTRQTGQDRQPRRIRRGPAEGAERVRPHVPDRFLVGVPLPVAIFAGPRGTVELVGDVIVLVPFEQVGVTALIDAGGRAILDVALQDGTRRDGRVLKVTLTGVGVDDDMNLWDTVAVHDIEGDAIERAGAPRVLAEVGMQPAVAVGA